MGKEKTCMIEDAMASHKGLANLDTEGKMKSMLACPDFTIAYVNQNHVLAFTCTFHSHLGMH